MSEITETSDSPFKKKKKLNEFEQIDQNIKELYEEYQTKEKSPNLQLVDEILQAKREHERLKKPGDFVSKLINQGLDKLAAEASNAIDSSGKTLAQLPEAITLKKDDLISKPKNPLQEHSPLENINDEILTNKKSLAELKDWDTFKNEILAISRLYCGGKFPKSRQLRELEYSSLEHAIHHHGGAAILRDRLASELAKYSEPLNEKGPPTKKSLTLLKNWEIFEKELKTLIINYFDNEFPTEKQILEIKYSSLSHAIRYHGGIEKVRERMGYELDQKPKGYWKIWENVERELRELISKKFKGQFPTDEQLQIAHFGGLRSALREHFGGLNAVRERMGYQLGRKPEGYWQKWEHVELELQQIILKNFKKKFGTKFKDQLKNKFPTFEELKDFDLTAKELKEIFPTANELRAMNLDGLVNVIYDHYGGLVEVQERLGFLPKRNPNGYWEKWEDIENTLKIIISKKPDKEFPTKQELLDSGYRGLVDGIYSYHKGLIKIRERMGYDLKQKPDGYWQKWEHLERELKEIIDEEFGGKFPSGPMLHGEGYSRLLSAMGRHHGGINEVRRRMGYEIPDWAERKSYYVKRGYSTEKIIKEILTEWAEINEFPISDKIQTEVGPGRFIEIICGDNKTYGVDVTNSKSKVGVEKKWKVQKYHEYVDELWVIVVSDKFKEHQYEIWNNESPENVLVIDYRELEALLNGLPTNRFPFKIKPEKLRKLVALGRCTWENKEKIKNLFKSQKGLEEF